ncbi:helix-turn-helix transcriptional regulator [Rhodococcus sp. IEGM 1379]|uniref:helix-turn-helix domain-containing protein n=1 Tax=Rhodococcus sp. IEGM 1379 TaxID=3047086 RepID=UPI0024B6AF9E|nr:helix-turn-helix transcriptional regulator [Rhodococcus sp. IEGM 1379]MDI9915446.1 helix-turn-helix transcriptional regulator [Rhodococcus sp. IEGM 1379]
MRREGNPERIAALKDKYRAKVRGARLAEIRKAYDLTQEQLAEQLDFSQKRVSRIERGDIDHTEVATVRRYIEALGERSNWSLDSGTIPTLSLPDSDLGPSPDSTEGLHCTWSVGIGPCDPDLQCRKYAAS